MNKNLSQETLGQRIRETRIRMGYTQEKLAEVMCVPKSTISAYENNKVDIKASVIVELSNHLATTPNYLLGFKIEEDSFITSAIVIMHTIKDEKIKALLIGQMKLAREMEM